jgi:hypothetical protein
MEREEEHHHDNQEEENKGFVEEPRRCLIVSKKTFEPLKHFRAKIEL